MSQIKKKALIVVLAAVLCAGLAACGSGDKKAGDTALVGDWVMTKITTGTSQLSAEDYKKSAGVSEVPVLTFESDGKVTLKTDGDTGTAVWSGENGAYTITYTSDKKEVTMPVESDGSTLTMKQDGYTLTYQKK